MPTLSILHIADPHWICRGWNLDSEQAERETREYQRLSDAFIRLRHRSAEPRHPQDRSILVHAGDSANFYNFHRAVPISQQFQQIGTILLPLLEQSRIFDSDYDLKLAVPGNHDVARSVTRGKIIKIEGSVVTCSFIRENGDAAEAFSTTNKTELVSSHLQGGEYIFYTTDPDAEKKRFAIEDNSSESLILSASPVRLKVGESFAIYPSDRFYHFKTGFHSRGWLTPWTNPLATVDLGASQVRFWLVNSSARCGMDRSSDGRQLDLVDIEDRDLEHWKQQVAAKASDDDLRIAILHHPPLPNYGSQNSKQPRDVFINNADFNKTLVETNVKLVLSGHQHIGDVVYGAMPQYAGEPTSGRVPALVESGFLSVSGPSFLRWEAKGTPGFYVIEIPFSDSLVIGDVRLTKYRYNFTSGEFLPESSVFQMAFNRLRDIYPKPNDRIRRRNILSAALSYTYGKKPIEPLERVLGIKFPQKSLDRWFDIYQGCRSIGDDNIYGLYSVSVLTPAAWWSLELTKRFRASFIDYLRVRERITSVINATDSHAETGFSASMLSAISQALENGERLAVEDALKQGDLDRLYHEDSKFLKDMLKKPEANVVSDLNRALDIILRCSRFGAKIRGLSGDVASWDIPTELPDEDHEMRLHGKYEVARIILWPLDYFKSDYALRVLEFHHDFGVPLFWLDPASLVGPRGEPRKGLGAFLLWAFRLPDRPNMPNRRTPQQWYVNNSSCEKAGGEDFYSIATDEESVGILERIWGFENVPQSLTSAKNPMAAEFKSLCRRPDLLFACDVFAMVKLGLEDRVLSFLGGTQLARGSWAISDL